MLVSNASPSPAVAPVQLEVQRNWSRLFEVLFWAAGVVFSFVVPLALAVGAILVSSYGIPLPIEVRVP